MNMDNHEKYVTFPSNSPHFVFGCQCLFNSKKSQLDVAEVFLSQMQNFLQHITYLLSIFYSLGAVYPEVGNPWDVILNCLRKIYSLI